MTTHGLTALEIGLAAAGGVGGVQAAGQAVRWGWRRGPGRRRLAAKALSRLGVGARPEYFERVLGPAAMRRSDGGFVRRTWITELYYVEAISEGDDEPILQWAVTTRSRRFRPTFVIAPHSSDRSSVTLLRTPFADSGVITGAHATVGARRGGYWQASYRGNPGDYCTFFLAANDAGVDMDYPLFADRQSARTGTEVDLADPEVQLYLRSAKPNTFGVIGPHRLPENIVLSAVSPGVDLDLVRVMP